MALLGAFPFPLLSQLQQNSERFESSWNFNDITSWQEDPEKKSQGDDPSLVWSDWNELLNKQRRHRRVGGSELLKSAVL